VFAQWSRAFQAPTLDQLFDPRPFPDFAGGTFTVSNPALAPQRASTVEAGGSGTAWGALGWEAAAYRIEVDDEIDFDPATFTYENIGRSLHTGVEATARWTGASAVRPFVSYAWTRVVARDGEDAGRQLKNVPRHLLRAGVAAELFAGLRGEAVASRMFGRWADDANAFPLEDGVVLDLRLERGFGPLTARLDVFNAAGVRTDAVGFTLPDFAGGQAPYSYPGPRRAVRVGVAYRP
jgi:outer membrane receptor protein involved in Fe transport